MKNLAKYSEILAALLVLLWIYTITSKLANFDLYQLQMAGQVFSKPISDLLVYAIPIAEIAATALLINKSWRFTGFFASALLLMLFTGYIILIITGYFPKTPCACGGVLGSLGWLQHLYFNLFWVILALTGILLEYKMKKSRERRSVPVSK